MASSSAKFVPLGELQEDEDEIQSISNEEKVLVLFLLFLCYYWVYNR